MAKSMEVAEGKDKLLGDVLDVIRFTEGISAKLHRLLDEAKIYQVVKEEFAKSDRYTMGIMLLVDDGASLKLAETSVAPSRLKVLERASGQQAKEYVIKLSKSSICRQVVGEGKTVHTSIGDLIGEILPRPIAYLISKTMGYDKQFSILTPINKHGKATGVLAMYSTDLGEYFAPPVENLALHISNALELADEHAQRKQAVQALEKYHGHLGELVEERTAELKEEITERKEAEEALKKIEQEKSAILNSTSELMVYQDTEHRILWTNKAAAESVALSIEQLAGRRCYEVWHQSNKPCVGCPVAKAREIGKPQEAEMTTPDGRVWFVRGYPLRDADEKLIGVVEVALEITERKRAEEALRESQEKFQKMFESVTDGISVVDLSGVIIETNQRAVEMHGFASRDELLGRSASELVAPRDRERIAANMRRAVKEGVVRGAEYTLLKTDGTEFPGELSTSVLRDASGKVVAHITIARDITERKRMEGALRESEERFRSIVENSQAGIMILDGAYRFVYVNDELGRISGYSRDELIGQDFRKFLDEESRELVAERYTQRQRGKEVPPRYEFNIIKKDGQKRRVEISSAVIKDSAGEVRTVAQLLDITERKRAAEALQAEKNKLQSLVDAMEDDLTIQDRDYNIIYQNEPSRISSGGDHVGEKCYRAYEGRDKICEGCPVEQAFKDGKSHTAERKTVAPSGETIFWETTANPIRDASGEIISCLEIGRNITGRKRAAEAMADEATRRRILVDQSRDGIVVLDENGKVYESNRRFAEMLGYTPEEVRELHVWDWDTQWKRAQLLKMVRSVDEVGDHFVTYHRCKDGTVIDVEISTNGAVCAGQKLVFCVCRDITERKQAEQALRESQKFSSNLLESSPNPITVVDLDTSIRYVNPAFEKLTGFTLAEIAGRKAPYPWWPEGRRERILAAFKDAIEHGGRITERNFQKKNGEHFWVVLNSAPIMEDGKPVYLIINWLDVTERKQAEEKEKQLQQELYLAQRLASVGELAAGVAHEINNPLTGVLGFSQRLMRKSVDEKVSHDLEVIHSEAQRAAEVVKSLLTFARRRRPKKEYTDINDIVNKTLELRAYALQTDNIKVVTTLAPRLPQIMVDFSQMQEVFLNIILNAEQAMGEARGKGKLTIKTSRIKDYVRVSFADNGPGIPSENLDKVFDPFFTTREAKGGTGLGLSACHGIVTEHGGRIYATSKPRKGATFFVELPLSPVKATTGRKG
jgi:PAS domain S-box-containing protein